MGLRNGCAFLMTTEGLGHVGDTEKAQQKKKRRGKMKENYKMTVNGNVLKKQKGYYRLVRTHVLSVASHI